MQVKDFCEIIKIAIDNQHNVCYNIDTRKKTVKDKQSLELIVKLKGGVGHDFQKL